MTPGEPEANPSVSVLMCAYNSMPYLEEAILCILNQTYPGWELLVSDDCSTDGTREFLRERYAHHERVKIFYQEKNLGYLANKNFLHQQAKGEYIAQLDSDDLCTIDRLEKQVRALQLNPGYKIAASGYCRISRSGKLVKMIMPDRDTVFTKVSDKEFPFWFPGFLVHREVFEKVGYFHPYFSGLFGDDFYWTMKAIGSFPVYCLRDALYSYRENPVSITNSYTDVRKLLIPAILTRLMEQRDQTSTDWIEQGNLEALARYEGELLKNRKFMSDQYGIWAARAIDHQKTYLGFKLMMKALRYNAFNFSIYQTMIYGLRGMLSRKHR